MRRTALIALGLLMVAGAIGAAGYRYWWKPPHVSEVAARKAPDTTGRRGPASTERPGQPGPRTQGVPERDISGFHVFEIILNVVNTLVGLVGIYLAVIGMRTPRVAAMSQSQSQGNGR